MKKTTLLTVLMLAVITLFSNDMNAQNSGKPTDEAVKNLKPYPKVVDSLDRHVIYLEQKEDENLYKVEIFAGKNMEVDCNNHILQGKFKEDIVQGWGFSYHVFETNGRVMSTMMLCHEPKEMKFVSGESNTVRYNSRLPLVVYLPQGYDLKYKIWTAGEILSADKQ